MSIRGGVEVGLVTSPEAETRVGAAGAGGEKRERDREGTAASNVDQTEGGRGGSGRDTDGRAWGRVG